MIKVKKINNNWLRNRFYVTVILFVILITSSIYSIAQNSVRANVTLDTNRIKIGEQIQLQFKFEISPEAKVFFPQLPDSMNRVEVVERSKIDSAKSEDGKNIVYSQTVTLTSFDPGDYYLEPFKFYFLFPSKGVDSAFTGSTMFRVETIPVDTTKEFRDIKPPLDVPFTLKEALPYIIGALIGLAIIILIVWLVKKYKRKKEGPKAPPRPAHEIAFEELKKVKDQNLWQDGFYKQYQSAVSDIIRTYIENRFGIQAMEMTSDETLEHFSGNLVNEEAKEKLKYILLLADTVKFAKAIPVSNENETSMQYAHEFVVLTKSATRDDFENIEKEEVKS